MQKGIIFFIVLFIRNAKLNYLNLKLGIIARYKIAKKFLKCSIHNSSQAY